MKKLMMFFVALSVSTVLTASVHFVTGPKSVDAGTQLVVSGKLSGLGVGDVRILVDAAGVASVECTNPGGNVAPGQDTEVVASGDVTLPVAKNGTVTFSVATVTPTIASSACPNNQWSAAAIDVAFSGGTITVVQGGHIVLQQGL